MVTQSDRLPFTGLDCRHVLADGLADLVESSLVRIFGEAATLAGGSSVQSPDQAQIQFREAVETMCSQIHKAAESEINTIRSRFLPDSGESLKRSRKSAGKFLCVLLEHNPNLQFNSKFKCFEPRSLRDLRCHIRHHIRPYYCEKCHYNAAEQLDLTRHRCLPSINRTKFPQRTPLECARNKQLVERNISLADIKRLLFEPCSVDGCNCHPSSFPNHMRPDTLHVQPDVFGLQNCQRPSQPEATDSVEACKMYEVTHEEEQANPHTDLLGGAVAFQEIDWSSFDNLGENPGAHPPSDALETGVADPRRIMFQRRRRHDLPWSPVLFDPSYLGGNGGPSNASRGQIAPSISETISSLTSLSLLEPPKKRSCAPHEPNLIIQKESEPPRSNTAKEALGSSSSKTPGSEGQQPEVAAPSRINKAAGDHVWHVGNDDEPSSSQRSLFGGYVPTDNSGETWEMPQEGSEIGDCSDDFEFVAKFLMWHEGEVNEQVNRLPSLSGFL